VLVDSTVVSNITTQTGGGVYEGYSTNCIIYFNNSPQSSNFLNDATGYISWSETAPLATNGFGNITNEPGFVSLANADYHLQTTSPAINSGNNAAVVGTFDLDGNARIVGGTVDIGAYEYQAPASIISYAWLQRYGLTTDGTADNQDLDGDGLKNWQEWKTGTDPTSAASVLQMLTSSNSIAGATVTWQSVAGINYFIQRSADLSAQPPFSIIQSNLIGQAGSTSYLDTSATNGTAYFYRVGVQ
jgi:hypothetical protein